MGSFVSTTHESNLDQPPPVQTRGFISYIAPLASYYITDIHLDELLQKYSHCLATGPSGISNEQQLWFETVFNTFCSQSVNKMWVMKKRTCMIWRPQADWT